MKQEKAYEVAELINYRLSAKISEVLENNLGVKTSFIATANTYNSGDYYVTCKSTGNDVQDQMTSTLLLRQLFKRVSLRSKVWYDEESNTITFSVDIEYDHNYDGGSNGHSIMAFSINIDTENIIIRK